MTRNRSTILATWLTETGDLALAEDICAEGLAQSRTAGDTWNIACQLIELADLDLRAGRLEDAAAHLREATQIVARTGIWFELRQHPAVLRAPVRRDRTLRRSPHGVGRHGGALPAGTQRKPTIG